MLPSCIAGLETLAPEVADAHVVSTALLLQGLLTDPVAAAMAEQEQDVEEGGDEQESDAYSSFASGGSMDEGVRGVVGVEGAAAGVGAVVEGPGGPVVDLERVRKGPGGSGAGAASYQLREELEEEEEQEGNSGGQGQQGGGVWGAGGEGQGQGSGKGRGNAGLGLGSSEAREVDPKLMSFSDDEELSWRLMTGGAPGGGPGGYR